MFPQNNSCQVQGPEAASIKHSGFSLVSIVAAIVVLSSLAAAITALTPAAMLSNVANPNEQRAYYLALSGLNYWSAGKTGAYIIDGDSFTLSQSGPDASGYYTITSLGRTRAGTGSEASIILTAHRYGLGPITFTNDLKDFSTPTVGKTANSSKAITIYSADLQSVSSSKGRGGNGNSSNTSPYASGSMAFGNGTNNTTGATWYVGDHGTCTGSTCPDGMCADGKCSFAKGLRAYFGFRFSKYDDSDQSQDYADGFTFTVMNGGNDPQTAAGGPSSGSSRGEYLGYAGPGPSGNGIPAPKMAVEVDIYPNNTDASDPTEVNSRNDNKSNANHVAVVYWGDPGTLYDDNVHGAGTTPQNPDGASSGYYEKIKQTGLPNWLEDKDEHAMRLEIERQTGDDAKGLYTVKVWIDPTGDGNDDVTADYTAESPQIRHTATLTAADHAKLATAYFGWTEGTGGSNQNVAIHDFALDFRR